MSRSEGSAVLTDGPPIVRRKGQYGHVPLRVVEVARVRISVGKLRGLQQISDDTGRFTMIAMDQRGSLQKMLHPENPKAATHAEMEAVKVGVTQALAPFASGYLLDPEYGLGRAVRRRRAATLRQLAAQSHVRVGGAVGLRLG